MEAMFEIDVVMPDKNGEWIPKTLALSIGMGIRISEDHNGVCWISLADNSVWRSPHDYRTTVDQISGILRNL